MTNVSQKCISRLSHSKLLILSISLLTLFKCLDQCNKWYHFKKTKKKVWKYIFDHLGILPWHLTFLYHLQTMLTLLPWFIFVQFSKLPPYSMQNEVRCVGTKLAIVSGKQKNTYVQFPADEIKFGYLARLFSCSLFIGRWPPSKTRIGLIPWCRNIFTLCIQ